MSKRNSKDKGKSTPQIPSSEIKKEYYSKLIEALDYEKQMRQMQEQQMQQIQQMQQQMPQDEYAPQMQNGGQYYGPYAQTGGQYYKPYYAQDGREPVGPPINPDGRPVPEDYGIPALPVNPHEVMGPYQDWGPFTTPDESQVEVPDYGQLPSREYLMSDMEMPQNQQMPFTEEEIAAAMSSPQYDTSYGGVSIVDFLKSIGKDSSKENRAALAKHFGWGDYDFSAKANTALMEDMIENSDQIPDGYSLVGKSPRQKTTRSGSNGASRGVSTSVPDSLPNVIDSTGNYVVPDSPSQGLGTEDSDSGFPWAGAGIGAGIGAAALYQLYRMNQAPRYEQLPMDQRGPYAYNRRQIGTGVRELPNSGPLPLDGPPSNNMRQLPPTQRQLPYNKPKVSSMADNLASARSSQASNATTINRDMEKMKAEALRLKYNIKGPHVQMPKNPGVSTAKNAKNLAKAVEEENMAAKVLKNLKNIKKFFFRQDGGEVGFGEYTMPKIGPDFFKDGGSVNTMYPESPARFANVNAEVKEVMFIPTNGSGDNKSGLFKIGGKPHKQDEEGNFLEGSGTNMYVETGNDIPSYILSHHKKIDDILPDGDPYTKKSPAELSWKVGKDLNKFLLALKEKNVDKYDKESYLLNVKNINHKLGEIAFNAEADKMRTGEGGKIPEISRVFLNNLGLDESIIETNASDEQQIAQGGLTVYGGNKTKLKTPAGNYDAYVGTQENSDAEIAKWEKIIGRKFTSIEDWQDAAYEYLNQSEEGRKQLGQRWGEGLHRAGQSLRGKGNAEEQKFINSIFDSNHKLRPGVSLDADKLSRLKKYFIDGYRGIRDLKPTSAAPAPVATAAFAPMVKSDDVTTAGTTTTAEKKKDDIKPTEFPQLAKLDNTKTGYSDIQWARMMAPYMDGIVKEYPNLYQGQPRTIDYKPISPQKFWNETDASTRNMADAMSISGQRPSAFAALHAQGLKAKNDAGFNVAGMNTQGQAQAEQFNASAHNSMIPFNIQQKNIYDAGVATTNQRGRDKNAYRRNQFLKTWGQADNEAVIRDNTNLLNRDFKINRNNRVNFVPGTTEETLNRIRYGIPQGGGVDNGLTGLLSNPAISGWDAGSKARLAAAFLQSGNNKNAANNPFLSNMMSMAGITNPWDND